MGKQWENGNSNIDIHTKLTYHQYICLYYICILWCMRCSFVTMSRNCKDDGIARGITNIIKVTHMRHLWPTDALTDQHIQSGNIHTILCGNIHKNEMVDGWCIGQRQWIFSKEELYCQCVYQSSKSTLFVSIIHFIQYIMPDWLTDKLINCMGEYRGVVVIMDCIPF